MVLQGRMKGGIIELEYIHFHDSSIHLGYHLILSNPLWPFPNCEYCPAQLLRDCPHPPQAAWWELRKAPCLRDGYKVVEAISQGNDFVLRTISEQEIKMQGDGHTYWQFISKQDGPNIMFPSQ
jgi:hypothetical protein